MDTVHRVTARPCVVVVAAVACGFACSRTPPYGGPERGAGSTNGTAGGGGSSIVLGGSGGQATGGSAGVLAGAGGEVYGTGGPGPAGGMVPARDGSAAGGSGSDGNLPGNVNAGGIGRPCNLSVDTGPAQTVYNVSASECPSQLCLKPQVQPGASGVSDTSPTCSAECSQDSDCEGELRDPSNPLDTRCVSGFVCGIPMVVGPLSCKKLCVCEDFLGPAGLSTPAACQSGTSNGTPTGGVAGVGQETDIYISVAPSRLLDLVFMVDNSPSMAPKAAKMNAQFPRLIDGLKDPNDGTLPDLRVAIIDSDLGTGGAYDGGSCGPNSENGGSNWGDQGKFMMVGATGCGVTSPDAQWLEYNHGQALNYSGDISQVFACLATNLGTQGCGEEHQLQALEWALVAKGVGNDAQQLSFLRANATLGLVFLSDEDDCSAATNDGMFGDLPGLSGESASLRCATRAHACAGRNLTESPPGYPTDAPYSHPFSDCMARTDSCPNPTDGTSTTDTSVPTDCSPLKDVHHLAEEIKSLKTDPDGQILVAGIFGWPLSDADMASATYKIDQVPNPNIQDTAHPRIFDSWPVCYDPQHMPSAASADPATGFDSSAAGWGATGGLRMSAFVDEFGDNGLKFSICQTDFSASLQKIGNAMAKHQQNLCVGYTLLDTDVNTPGLQPDCRVVYRIPEVDPANPNNIIYQENSASMPQCPVGATQGNVDADCWQLGNDTTRCPINGQTISVLRTAAEIQAGPLAAGTKIGMQCLTCSDGAANLDPNSDAYKACNY